MLVVLAQQCRASEGRSQPLGAVDHALDDCRVVKIGGGHRIGSKHGHPQRSAFHKNGEDVDRVIVLDRFGDLPQIGGEPIAVEFSYQHFGESRVWGGATGSAAGPASWVVNGKGSLIEIAFELKAGLADEALVFRIVADGGQFLARVGTPGPV